MASVPALSPTGRGRTGGVQAAAWLAASGLWAGPGVALEANVGGSLGAQYSDNILLAPPGQEDPAWMSVAAVSFGVGDRTDQREARLVGSLEYVNYTGDEFDDEFTLAMSGTGRQQLSDTLSWYLEDQFNQATVDPLAAPVPSNQQDVNVFTTGPEWRFPVSRSQTLVTGARYEHFYYETSDTDSQRLAGYGRWSYAMDPRRDLSVNLEASGTNYKADRYPDLRRGDLFLRLAQRWPRASVELDGGATVVQRDGVDDVSGPLGRFRWRMPFNTRHGLDLYVTHQYTDVGTYILDSTTRPASGENPAAGTQIVGDVFYNRRAELAYHWTGLFTTARVVVAGSDENYETAPADRHYDEAAVGATRDLRENLRLSLDGLYRRTDYRQAAQVNTERTAIATLIYKLNRRLSLNAQAAHAERDSDYAPARYRENRVFVSLGYNQAAEPGRLPGSLPETEPLPGPGIGWPTPGGASGGAGAGRPPEPAADTATDKE